MKKNHPESKSSFRVPATRAEFLRILGDKDDAVVAEILALRPTVAELEEVALRAAGQAEELGESERPPGSIVDEILEILSASEEDEEEAKPRH